MEEKKTETEASNKKKYLPYIVVAGIIAAFVAFVGFILVIIGVIVLATNSGPTIKLNDYVDVSTYGYDGSGYAYGSIRWSAIERDYAGKLKRKDGAVNTFGGFVAFMDETDMLDSYVYVKLDNTSGLSNGDVINYEIIIDNGYKDCVKCHLKGGKGKVRVRGL